MSEIQAPAQAYRDGPEGIGGWLVLPIIGMFLTPVQALLQLGQYSGLGDNFQFLTFGQKAFVSLEIIGNVAIALIFPIVLLILLFNKRRAFPRLYVVWAVANLVFILGDLLAAKILFGELFEASGTQLIDGETMQAIFRAIVLMAIWVPYMLNSRRVRNTFVL
jgi:hypothetical protein